MRLFPADFVPNLSVAPPEMLGAWVMPWYLPRRHKDRLWSLLVRGLHRFDDRLHFIELHWAERHHVEDGRLRLPRPVVVRLLGQPLSSAAPATIVEFANKWMRGTPVFDFEDSSNWQSFGWLGPFKVRVLHCVMDVLLDRPPIADTQPIVDTLQEAARLLLTPIELLDFAELILERIAFGVSTESARAMAFGDAFAARFESIYSADTMAKVLSEAAGNALSDPIKRALVRVGLVDGSTRLPLLDLVHDPEIRQRAMEAFSRRMGEVRSVEEPLEEKPPAPARIVDEPVKEIELPPANAAIASPIVRDALARILDDQIEAGTKLLVDAWRDGAAESFSKEDALVAGMALLRVATTFFKHRHNRAENYHRVVMLCEGATAYLERAHAADELLRALILGGKAAHETNELDAGLRLVERAKGIVTEKTGRKLAAELYVILGKLRQKAGDFEGATVAFEQVAALGSRAHDIWEEADARTLLGLCHLETLSLGKAQVELLKALALHEIQFEVGTINLWPPHEATTHILLGTVYFHRADFVKANACYESARAKYEQDPDQLRDCELWAHFGNLCLRRGDVVGAKSAFKDAIWSPYGVKGLGDVALFEGMFVESIKLYRDAMYLIRDSHVNLGDMLISLEEPEDWDSARLMLIDAAGDPKSKSSILRAIARLKFIVNEPHVEELQAAADLAAQAHDLYGIWLSKSLRAAISPPEEPVPLLAECADFFESKGMPWETCILRAIIALFHGETAEQIQALLQPMLGGTRAEVIAALVRANRTKDAHHALLIQLPTG